MATTSTFSTKVGTGALFLVFLLLAGLKVAGLVCWGWWAITAPLWEMWAEVLLLKVLVVLWSVLVVLARGRR